MSTYDRRWADGDVRTNMNDCSWMLFMNEGNQVNLMLSYYLCAVILIMT
jgi:hypothetical protein